MSPPLLIWQVCHKVTFPQVWSDIELVITVCCYLMLARAEHRYTVLAHQATCATLAEIQANFFQFFRYSWATVAIQAETRRLLNVR